MHATDRPFRWAILGTGPVARKFVLALDLLGGRARVEVVASRDPAKARSFATTLGIGRAVADYAEAVAAEVDAVYVATPPALHEAHAMLAIGAGLAVLIEKPLATDAAAAQRIADAAAARGIFVMEAMWTRFLPLLSVVRSRIEAGAIGEPRGFEGAFLAATRPDPGLSLYDPTCGGGALLNRGVYPLSLARFLMGPVAETKAVARIGETGVDEETALTLRHTSGAASTIRASLRSAGEPPLAVYGTEGTIRFDGPVWRPTGATLVPVRAGPGMSAPARFERLREAPLYQALSRRAEPAKRLLHGGGRAIRAELRGSGYQYEAAEVMERVRLGATASEVMPMSESIEILEVIDMARAQWA
jgi:predicted dehydrogenase